MRFVERQKNQAILINEHIRVTILEVRDGEVTVAIESDQDPTLNRIETMLLAGAEAELTLAGAGV